METAYDKHKEVFDRIINRNQLAKFLSLPAPDRVFPSGFTLPQTRIAENKRDFQAILKREQDKEKLNDVSEIELLKKDLIQYIKDLIELHRGLSGYEHTDRKLVNKAQKFIEFLNSKQETKKEEYSVLQWATIFYYAEITSLTSGSTTKDGRMQDFIKKHNIQTRSKEEQRLKQASIKSFRNTYYKVCHRMAKDYPIAKLEGIIPFLEKNYKKVVNKVLNDIEYLKEEQEEQKKDKGLI
ncbi:MAG: hypothetical protein WCR58_12320 [Bacteroidales bacterium]|jgi:hypothetical protein|nr:hypothetical protein [Bacteroidales bacterium]MCK9448883.1 hypothetical protein [Bacteroidales bacterium]MDD3700902.1 hypothetical protein [Bacteroidales bacterium]MDY0370042.1 hypothetical protein [Bacteroidales bacterium]